MWDGLRGSRAMPGSLPRRSGGDTSTTRAPGGRGSDRCAAAAAGIAEARSNTRVERMRMPESTGARPRIHRRCPSPNPADLPEDYFFFFPLLDAAGALALAAPFLAAG